MSSSSSFFPPAPLIHLLFALNPEFEFRIYLSIREIIEKLKLYDPRNPELFVFARFPPLQAALGTNMCLVHDLRCIIRQRLGFHCQDEQHNATQVDWLRGRGSLFVAGPSVYPETDMTTSESLRRFLAWRGLPGPLYRAEVVATAITAYIFENRRFVLHPLDSNIVVCSGDPLATALQVSIFHYSRLADLLACHLSPVEEPEPGPELSPPE